MEKEFNSTNIEIESEHNMSDRKRKRVSRNKKKGWKATNIDDVESFLEDKRLQERTGGLVSDKKDESLFFVDTKVAVEEEIKTTKKRKREARALKCHSNLIQVDETEPVKTKKIKKKLEKHQKKTTKKSKQEVQKSISNKKRSERGGDVDLWNNGDEKKEDEDVLDHHLTVTKQKRRKVPKRSVKLPSELTAIDVAHPGASYNPTFDDHQNLLWEAHTVEVRLRLLN